MRRLCWTLAVLLCASVALAAVGSMDNAVVDPTGRVYKRAQKFNAGVLTDDIAEATSGAGVTIDGVLLKDGAIAACTTTATDAISEATSGAGVTVDGVLLKDAAVTATGAATAGSAVIGGGYGSTGATISTAGAISANGALVVDGTSTLTGAVTVGQADVTIPAVTNGGNAGVKNEFIGLPRIKLAGLGSATNGAASGKTVALMDDTPTGEWVAHDAETTVTANTTYYRAGTTSLGVLFGTGAVAGNGAHDGVTHDYSADESVGMWVMCDTALTAGDLVFTMTDDGGAQSVNFPAYASSNVWTWAELDISGIADSDKNVVTDVSIALSSAGALVVAGGAVQCYFDGAYKWDSTEEDSLGVSVLRDGVLGVVNTTTGASLAEYTDYFVHEQTGNDAVVWITDQSAATPVVLVAY